VAKPTACFSVAEESVRVFMAFGDEIAKSGSSKQAPGIKELCFVPSLCASENDIYVHHDLFKTIELTIAFLITINDLLLFVWGVQLAFWQGSMGHPLLSFTIWTHMETRHC